MVEAFHSEAAEAPVSGAEADPAASEEGVWRGWEEGDSSEEGRGGEDSEEVFGAEVIGNKKSQVGQNCLNPSFGF